MTYYVYVFPSRARSSIGILEGMNGFIPSNHFRFKEYIRTTKNPQQNAYEKVCSGNMSLTSPNDVDESRNYSVQDRAVVIRLNRLLTVRSEWSKK